MSESIPGAVPTAAEEAKKMVLIDNASSAPSSPGTTTP